MDIKEFENNLKGEIGEKTIAWLLNNRSDEKFVIFHNVGVPCGDDIQQIDLIYVTKQAVFVIESKNWAGLITGKFDDKHWYSVLPKKRNEHYNPIKQNATHIKFLNKIIDVNIPLYSLIVFPDSSDISSIYSNGKFVKVLQYSDLNRTIDLIISDADYEMSNKKFDEVCTKIEPFNEIDNETHKKHIERIKSRYANKTNIYTKEENIKNDNRPIDNSFNWIWYVVLIIIVIFIYILIFTTHNDKLNNNTYDFNYNYNINANKMPRIVGWKENAGRWYYYSAEGIMIKNAPVQDNGKIYYIGADGAMVKDNIVQYGNNFFYFGSDGIMIANSWDPSGQYYFGTDGRLELTAKIQNDDILSIKSNTHNFNIVSYNYFKDTFLSDNDYLNECDVSIIIPIFQQQTPEDLLLNNAINDAIHDIATDIEEEFYDDEYIFSIVLDKCTLYNVNEDVVSIKLTGKKDYTERLSYIIEYDRYNHEYSYYND